MAPDGFIAVPLSHTPTCYICISSKKVVCVSRANKVVHATTSRTYITCIRSSKAHSPVAAASKMVVHNLGCRLLGASVELLLGCMSVP